MRISQCENFAQIFNIFAFLKAGDCWSVGRFDEQFTSGHVRSDYAH